MTTDWWLKVKRAQKHMVDINREALRYASSEPYEFTRIRQPNSQGQVAYRVRITEQPDPMIAVMLGDFIHNLRSALDYIVVASVPRQRQKSASFPIVSEDIWATDKDGNFVVNDPKRREDFETAIRGLALEAWALVILAQPYHWGTNAYRHMFGIISRLENADKHRQLIAVGSGVGNIRTKILIPGLAPGLSAPWPQPVLDRRQFAKDGTVVRFTLPADLTAPDGTVVQPSEVHMEFTGTAEILIKITRIGGNEPPSDFGLHETMLMAIQDVREILRRMELFVPLIQ